MQRSVRVRRADPDDVEAMAAVQAAGWREGFAGIVPAELTPSPEQLAERIRERFAAGAGERIVAEVDGAIHGFCAFGPSRDEGAPPDVGEVYVLFVDPRAWRGGVGAVLVHHALAELEAAGCAHATLWSARENARANAFYEALGFRRDGARQRRPVFGDVIEIRYRRELRPRP